MAIDKAKGIVCKPMPRYWHDRHAANKFEDDDERTFNRAIVADKKPYFMRYIYPDLMKQYNTYIKNTDRNALREFQMTVNELRSLDKSDLSEEQADFLRYYAYRMPVGTGDCVMNRICRRFEEEFDGVLRRMSSAISFDYTNMRGDAEYTQAQFSAIKSLYSDFNKRLQNYAVFADYERIDAAESSAEMSVMVDEFKRECGAVCANSDTLCNIILDIAYTRSSTKRFAWSMCGHEIIQNLLKKNNMEISFPVRDDDGDIMFGGEKFSVMRKVVGNEE